MKLDPDVQMHVRVFYIELEYTELDFPFDLGLKLSYIGNRRTIIGITK